MHSFVRPFFVVLLALASTAAWQPQSAQAEALRVTAVATSWEHSCAVLSSSRVDCWGLAENLGSGYQFQSSRPLPVRSPLDIDEFLVGVSAVTGGYSRTCALTTEGAVLCWPSLRSWEVVQGLGSGVAAISAGWGHTCALLETSEIRCWGLNQYGQLGDGTTVNRLDPVTVLDHPGGPAATGFVSVSAGYQHTCATTDEGAVKCWGSGTLGLMGPMPPDVCVEGSSGYPCSTTPLVIDGLEGAASVGAGYWHTCTVALDGSVFCWGLNMYGQLGAVTGSDCGQSCSSSPIQVRIQDVVKVAGGFGHTCALKEDGTVYCWGKNEKGELGDGTGGRSTNRHTPGPVVGLPGRVTDLAIGSTAKHTCAIIEGGSLYCWGFNDNGQIGISSEANTAGPLEVQFDSDLDGCTDSQELGPNPALGGMRNPDSYWDFFNPSLEDWPEANYTISMVDIIEVLTRLGSTGDATIDPLSFPPATTSYHTAYDRARAGPGPWQTGPPNGSITIEDVTLVVAQFGHSCA